MVFFKWANPGLFLFIFDLFLQFQYKLNKVQMVCLGFEPGAAGWQAQTKPRSYGQCAKTSNIISAYHLAYVVSTDNMQRTRQHYFNFVLFFPHQNYFGDPWNSFDFIIVLGSLIDIAMAEINVSFYRDCLKPPDWVTVLFTRSIWAKTQCNVQQVLLYTAEDMRCLLRPELCQEPISNKNLREY